MRRNLWLSLALGMTLAWASSNPASAFPANPQPQSASAPTSYVQLTRFARGESPWRISC